MDSQTKTQTGWCNHETWLMDMWLNNEYDHYVELQRLQSRHQFDIDSFAQALKDWVHEEFSLQAMPPGMWCDLVNASFNRVNWYQIAENNM